jgi:hypothetical protein
MVPRNFAKKKDLDKRVDIFNELRMTSHWPHKPKLFPKVPRTYGKKIKNISDITIEQVSNYITIEGLSLI